MRAAMRQSVSEAQPGIGNARQACGGTRASSGTRRRPRRAPGENFLYVFKAARKRAARAQPGHGAPCRFALGAPAPAARNLSGHHEAPASPIGGNTGPRILIASTADAISTHPIRTALDVALRFPSGGTT
jgi:hypothetical protein